MLAANIPFPHYASNTAAYRMREWPYNGDTTIALLPDRIKPLQALTFPEEKTKVRFLHSD
jgi:hypothetical protein